MYVATTIELSMLGYKHVYDFHFFYMKEAGLYEALP